MFGIYRNDNQEKKLPGQFSTTNIYIYYMNINPAGKISNI